MFYPKYASKSAISKKQTITVVQYYITGAVKFRVRAQYTQHYATGTQGKPRIDPFTVAAVKYFTVTRVDCSFFFSCY
jgi:hypothetical protein